MTNEDTWVWSTNLSETHSEDVYKTMMTSIPGTESNYIKIALLVLRISQKAVRVKFDFELHPKCLQKTLYQHKSKLQDLLQKKKIHKDQWVLLFPPKEKGKTN